MPDWKRHLIVALAIVLVFIYTALLGPWTFIQVTYGWLAFFFLTWVPLVSEQLEKWTEAVYDSKSKLRQMFKGRMRRAIGPEHKSGGHYLYRWYDKNNNLLYVGITSRSVFVRALEHQKRKKWVKDASRLEWRAYTTRREVEDAEKRAIQREDPKYNVIRY